MTPTRYLLPRAATMIAPSYSLQAGSSPSSCSPRLPFVSFTDDTAAAIQVTGPRIRTTTKTAATTLRARRIDLGGAEDSGDGKPTLGGGGTGKKNLLRSRPPDPRTDWAPIVTSSKQLQAIQIMLHR